MTSSFSRRVVLVAAALVASFAVAAASASAASAGDLVQSQRKGAVSTQGASWH